MKTRIYVLFPIVFQTIIYTGTRIIFSLCARLTIEGLEHVKKLNGPAIFAPNHQTEWDGPLVRTSLPFFSKKRSPMYFVGMKDNGYSWKDFGWRSLLYQGEFFKMLGAYPTYPGNNNYALSLKDHIELLNHGRDVCIFPEGEMSKNGVFGEPHGGVAFLSHYTKVPVVPVAIIGLAAATVKDVFLRRCNVTIRFGKPIYPLAHPPVHEDEARIDYKAHARKIFNEVKKLVNNG